MPQKVLKSGGSGSSVVKRKNAPVKRKRNFHFDKKGTKAVNRAIEEKAAAKALRNESKFNFAAGDLNQKGKSRVSEEDKERERRAAKKRSAADRQVEVIERLSKKSKNDLE